MEVIGAIVTVMGCLNKVVALIEKSKERGGALSCGLGAIKDDFGLITDLSKLLQLKPGMQLRLQELAFDVDDFIQDLWVPGPVGSFVLTVIGADNRPGYILRTGGFEKRIKILKDDLGKNIEPRPSEGTSSPPARETSTPAGGSRTPYAQEVDLVGIEGPKKEIVELLSPRADPHHRGIGVISMVGCRGSGKTALARAIYEDKAVVKDFDYKAWVVASDHSSADILNKILREVVPASAPGSISEALQQFINKILRRLRLPASTPGSTSEALQNLLNKILRRWNISQALEHFPKDKRYLIFLDDVQRGAPWKGIKEAFDKNNRDIRIIVTTSAPSVARACSSGSYMYTMQHLNKENSRKLFRAKFREEDGNSAEDEDGLDDDDIDIIINKCDGLPMALIAAAKYLRLQLPDPRREHFEQVSQELGDCLDGIETTFAEMRRAHVEPYENLLNHGEKECLLYVSLFSHGHQTNSKSLVRRLIAEGLVPRDADMIKASKWIVGDVRKCLMKLMDHCMIEPVPIRNYYNAAKRCRVHSIMLEFAIKKAVSRNLVSLIQKGQPLHNKAGKVRRLTVQSSPDVGITEAPEGIGLSVVRSVAIFNSGIPNLQICKLVRVLDLEGCLGLTREILGNICGLLFLKYLSLRKTDIQELPEGVTNLQCLETLDTRDTVVIQLPVEVIMLPRFAYLFGQFELTNLKKNKKKLKNFFKGNESQLHTLGGICLDEAQGLQVVVLVLEHATKLKKVKAWCKCTLVPDSSSLAYTLLSNLENRRMNLESVSVDFNGVPNTFSDFLGTICTGTIGSIKVRRGDGNLPAHNILQTARNLRKLHLFSTGRTSEQLADLQYLQCLEYLKLAEPDERLWSSIFHVTAGGFKILKWLCFEAPKLPPVEIEKGAMTLLCSLQLLCPEGPVFTGIPHLPNLNEVILHNSASDAKVREWKEEAERHINRPYVEKKQV